ncbi:MAG: heparan-alpha-glucosaminide N-acetyltransferase domain-containing protein [Chitinophagaceae bacterium]
MNQRYYSLDVFRGATVCLMILVNNPGSWSHIYPPLEHAPWHGLTPTDLVFPFFLFAVGNALSFVMPRLEAGGDALFWKKVLKRTALIFLIGLFLNWWPFVRWQDGHLSFIHWVNPANPEKGVRLFGVLQRIAVCYFFASILVYYLKLRKSFYAGLVLLLLYWLLCYAGNPADPYSLEGWFGTAIDKAILGVPHLYKGEGVPFDPEGLMSTIPAIVQVLFGYMVGDYIQKKGKNFEMLSGLFVAAVAMLVMGFCWDMAFPINKKIWTSSYTLYTSGLATLTIATMIYLIEFRNVRGGLAKFFVVFGKNALFVFALSAFLPKGLGLIRFGDGVNPWNLLYTRALSRLPGDPRLGSLVYALCVIIFMWAICYWMDKKKIYVRV